MWLSHDASFCLGGGLLPTFVGQSSGSLTGETPIGPFLVFLGWFLFTLYLFDNLLVPGNLSCVLSGVVDGAASSAGGVCKFRAQSQQESSSWYFLYIPYLGKDLL